MGLKLNLIWVCLGTLLLSWFGSIKPALAELSLTEQIVTAQNAADTNFLLSYSGLVLFMTVGLFLRWFCGQTQYSQYLNVGIKPSAGFVSPLSALAIGCIAAIACYFAINLKVQMGIDDSLDTFPVHGVGGIVGTILTGVFASQSINGIGANGLLLGNPYQLIIQIGALVFTIFFSAVGTFILIQVVVPLRLEARAEL